MGLVVLFFFEEGNLVVILLNELFGYGMGGVEV